MDLKAIQSALRERKFDAWLFYDHHHRDPIAYRVLGLPDHLMVTRRWYYVVPAEGEPQKVSHRIESHHLDSLPGKKHEYSSWQEQHEALKKALGATKKIAMEYSPNNAIPLIGLVDAGTVELLRSFGKEVVSSADLVTLFEATWSQEQVRMHLEAGEKVDRITAAAFVEIGRRVRQGGTHEYEIQQWFQEQFKRDGLVTPDGPIVAVNANAGNPHYEPSLRSSQKIKEGDWVLLDVWAKLDKPDSVFYDITWTGFVGKSPSAKHREIFDIVTGARDVGIKIMQETIGAGRKLHGWEVDKATREFIESKGYGQYFTHRTGHSIGSVDVHGNGPNIDNLETKDDRELVPYTCNSIEPGIYLPEFGVRSEVDVLVTPGKAEVTGKIQREIVLI
jgi:Xaa-Pro aminopeptidase